MGLFGSACSPPAVDFTGEAQTNTFAQGQSPSTLLNSDAPTCRQLISLATKAHDCDPKLARLADQIHQSPNELGCRKAIRELLTSDRNPNAAETKSLYEIPDSKLNEPLDSNELRQINALVFPSHIYIKPDLPEGPGVPPTAVLLSGVVVHTELKGNMHAYRPPGQHDLVLRHAGRVEHYCLVTKSCETIRLTAHAAHLAQHPNVRPGPCKSKTKPNQPKPSQGSSAFAKHEPKQK